MLLNKKFEDKDLKTVKTKDQYKDLFRTTIPDRLKRDMLLQYFNLNPMSCEQRYSTIVKMAGDDFLEHTKKAHLASKSLEYQFLNDNGVH